MRIWVDGQCFQTPSSTRGIGRYVADFLIAMAARDDVELIISLNANLRDAAFAARQYLNIILPDVRIESWYGIANASESERGWTAQRKADGQILAEHIHMIEPDIALCPSPFEGIDDRASPFLAPHAISCASACIFHDAIPHRYPEQYFYNKNVLEAYYRRLEAVGRYDVVLCNSQFTANEYREILLKQNCVVIGAGLSQSFQHTLLETQRRYNDQAIAGGTDFAIYVGGLDWRKNVAAMVTAMAQIPQCRSGAFGLLLVGDHSEPELAPLRALWLQSGLPVDGLRCTGWVSDAQLVDLYRTARMAIQPSLMEGFGLSALEAMAAGCCLIAARGGAVAEVVGREDLLFDGHQPQDLARLIALYLDDDGCRQEAVEYGLNRVLLFHWKQSAILASEALRHIGKPRESRTKNFPVSADMRRRMIVDVTSTTLSPIVSGIQRVVRRLSEALIETGQAVGVDTVLSFADTESGWYELATIDPAFISHDPVRLIPCHPGDSYLLMDSSWIYCEAQRDRLVDALIMGQPVIHMVHDLGPLFMPALTHRGMSEVFANWFVFMLGHSTGIICVSRTVADEVADLLAAIAFPRAMKIGFLQPGSDFSRVDTDSGWLTKLPDRPTFLMVGTIEPRKGHACVLRAFDKLWRDGVDANLLIVGQPGWNTRLLRAQLEFHPELDRRLFLRAKTSDGELRAAYEQATALIMASRLEGFGLPVIEAERFGCPLILSDIPVFREAAADVLDVDFFQVDDAAGLARIVACMVQEVARMGRRIDTSGRRRAPTWDAAAKQMNDIIFNGNWYRHHIPQDPVPNVTPLMIGQRHMDRQHPVEEIRYVMRYVDGPLVSDNGHDVQFIIALRNQSDFLWSSSSVHPEEFGLRIAVRLMADGRPLSATEEAIVPIPLVLPPGKELLASIRVSSDHLAQGATCAKIQMIQGNDDLFGDILHLELTQAPWNDEENALPLGTAGLRPFVLRGPFSIGEINGRFLILGIINRAHHAILLNAAGRHGLEFAIVDDKMQCIEAAQLVSAFSRLAGGSCGLLTLRISSSALARAHALTVSFDPVGQTKWIIDLRTCVTNPL